MDLESLRWQRSGCICEDVSRDDELRRESPSVGWVPGQKKKGGRGRGMRKPAGHQRSSLSVPWILTQYNHPPYSCTALPPTPCADYIPSELGAKINPFSSWFCQIFVTAYRKVINTTSLFPSVYFIYKSCWRLLVQHWKESTYFNKLHTE